MPAPRRLVFDPITIRYDGIDAESHEIDLALLGKSLQGASRLLAVAGHIAMTGTYVSKVPAMSVRVLAAAPKPDCFEISAHIYTIGPLLLPLLSHAGREAGKKTVEAIVNYVLTNLGSGPGEADKALDVVKEAISANKEVTLKALDVAQHVVKAGEDQRPAARDFVSPVKESVATARIGERDKAFVVDGAAKDRIDGPKEETEIGPSQTYTILISELDIQTGTAKVTFHGDDAEQRYSAEITDPVVKSPRSAYSAALDSQGWIKVTAKPHIRAGDIQKLTISDTRS